MPALILLGGAQQQDDAGNTVQGRPAQRHCLALLALLALERAGLSRDKLIAYLWPTCATATARHRLSVAMHVIRHAFGDDALVASGDAVALGPRRWQVDVWRFHDLLAAGELEGAAACYGGPLLDGFFLRDARQFEGWLDGRRERLARRNVAVLESLAVEAEECGDWARAAARRRELVASDRCDATYAVGLMRCLAASGHPVAAMRTARAYDVYVRADYGLEPDPAVAECIDALMLTRDSGREKRPS